MCAPGFPLSLGSRLSVSSPFIAPPAGALIHVPALGRDLPLLLDVPDAGRLAGLSRYASYRAAEDGTMPTLRLGERRAHRYLAGPAGPCLRGGDAMSGPLDEAPRTAARLITYQRAYG